ncbi:MAG: acyltransferase [Opitutales bacterium]|nr:acyltransferase [Opitutales bacterium]
MQKHILRDRPIETLRGLAALLLVAYHSIEVSPEVPKGSDVYAYFAYTFSMIRMPLFTVISGYVYAMRPLLFQQPNCSLRFFTGKARRLLLPLFGATAIYAGLRWVGGSEPEASAEWWEWLSFFTHSYHVYWFLQGLLWVFVFTWILEKMKLLSKLKSFIPVFIITTVMGSVMPGSDLFSFWALGYLAPFFLLGLGLRRFEHQLNILWVSRLMAGVAIASLLLQQMIWWKDLPINITRFSWMSALVGMSCCWILVYKRFHFKPLAKIGKDAFPIYLYHLIGIAIATMLLRTMEISGNTVALFFLKVLMGVGLPMLMNEVLKRNSVTRLIFLGLKKSKKRGNYGPHKNPIFMTGSPQRS